jgi:hypothetical protein
MKTEDGQLRVVSGASRSGKTAWVEMAVRKAGRVLAWDPEDQWSQLPGWRRVTSRAEMLKLIQSEGPQKLAFVVGGDLAGAFNFWAGCVMHAGRYYGPLVAIAEELADVTTTQKAPGNWGILLRRGLKRGITIYAISQRWAEADKTAMGNATDFIIFRQGTGDDDKYMARKTRVSEQEIADLEQLQFVIYNKPEKKIERGRMPFDPRKAAKGRK